MTPIDWATRPLKKYADFSGRARVRNIGGSICLSSSSILSG
jgi:hypothetical protein